MRTLVILLLALMMVPDLLSGHVGSGITFDGRGRLYFCDTLRDIVWRVEADGSLALVARGVHTNVLWIRPDGTVDHPEGGYLADTVFSVLGADGAQFRIEGHRVLRREPDGAVTPLAGDTVPGYSDGLGRAARFHRPVSLAVDSAGTLYVADYGNRRVRKITAAGVVSTVGRSGGWWFPAGLAVGDGQVYVLERGGNYWGPTGILARIPVLMDLMGPRVRSIVEDEGMTTVAAAGAAPHATGLLLAGAAVALGLTGWWVGRARRRRQRTVDQA